MTYKKSFIKIGEDSLDEFLKFVKIRKWDKLTLLMDQVIYEVLGRKVKELLTSNGVDVKMISLSGDRILPDEKYVCEILAQLNDTFRPVVCVGSGVMTDLTRFTATRMRVPYVSIPTAPSMDGYTSKDAAMVLDGFRKSIPSRPPVAVFVHLPTLCAAPKPMAQAGWGDMIGKMIALPDWRLSQLLGFETIITAAYEKTRKTLKASLQFIEKADPYSDEGISLLIGALLESGRSMVIAGNSRPASGGEHSLSHYWDMQLIRQNKNLPFHGLKVGFATLHCAKIYERIRGLSREEAAARFSRASLPKQEVSALDMTALFGRAGTDVLNYQKSYLDMSTNQFELFLSKMVEKWDDIQEIAASAPSVTRVEKILRKIEIPTDPSQFVLPKDLIADGYCYAYLVRNAFTCLRLAHYLGLEVE